MDATSAGALRALWLVLRLPDLHRKPERGRARACGRLHFAAGTVRAPPFEHSIFPVLCSFLRQWTAQPGSWSANNKPVAVAAFVRHADRRTRFCPFIDREASPLFHRPDAAGSVSFHSPRRRAAVTFQSIQASCAENDFTPAAGTHSVYGLTNDATSRSISASRHCSQGGRQMRNAHPTIHPGIQPSPGFAMFLSLTSVISINDAGGGL